MISVSVVAIILAMLTVAVVSVMADRNQGRMRRFWPARSKKAYKPKITVLIKVSNLQQTLKTIDSLSHCEYAPLRVVVLPGPDNSSSVAKVLRRYRHAKCLDSITVSRLVVDDGYGSAFDRYGRAGLIFVLNEGSTVGARTLRRAAMCFNDPDMLAVRLAVMPTLGSSLKSGVGYLYEALANYLARIRPDQTIEAGLNDPSILRRTGRRTGFDRDVALYAGRSFIYPASAYNSGVSLAGRWRSKAVLRMSGILLSLMLVAVVTAMPGSRFTAGVFVLVAMWTLGGLALAGTGRMRIDERLALIATTPFVLVAVPVMGVLRAIGAGTARVFTLAMRRV